MGDRTHWVPAAAYFNLNAACRVVNEALSSDGYGCCFHVGSSLARAGYRDVDVRFIMKDDAFARLFGETERAPQVNALWSVMCSGIACWLQRQTGLPVDFQIQQMTRANREYGGAEHPRSALGRMGPTPADYAKERLDERHEADQAAAAPAAPAGGECRHGIPFAGACIACSRTPDEPEAPRRAEGDIVELTDREQEYLRQNGDMARRLGTENAALVEQVEALRTERDSLKAEVERLEFEKKTLQEIERQARGALNSLLSRQDRLQAELAKRDAVIEAAKRVQKEMDDLGADNSDIVPREIRVGQTWKHQGGKTALVEGVTVHTAHIVWEDGDRRAWPVKDFAAQFTHVSDPSEPEGGG